jgi:hypothetical protein
VPFCFIICRHNLEIPETIRQEVSESLRSSLAGSSSLSGSPSRRKKRTKSEELLHGSVASHETYLTEQKALRETSNEDGLVTIFTQYKQEMQSELPELDLRVKDGKFIVLNYFDKDPKDEEKENEISSAGSGGERRYAKQEIQTVKTTNICYQLYYLVKRCIRNKGKMGKYSVEKTIIDKVNLYFEPGKMYLVMYVTLPLYY